MTEEPGQRSGSSCVVVGPWLTAHDRVAERFPGTVAYVPADWMPHPGPVVAATRHDRDEGEIRLVGELARRDRATLLLAHVWGMPEVRQGHHVAAELERLAGEASASAIVIGRARMLGGRSPLGPIAHSLLRDAPCAVIIVGTRAPGDLRP